MLSALNVAYLIHQNQKIIAIFDFSYFTDLATRINLGEMPYRDFPVASNPGSFYALAFLLDAFPQNYNAILFYMAIQNTFVIIAMYWILNQFITEAKKKYLYSFLIFLPTLNIYSIFHQPFYDADAIFSVVFSILLITKVEINFIQNKRNNSLILFFTGISIFIPYVFKQNIGIPWLFFWLAVGTYKLLYHSNKTQELLKILFGVFTSLIFFATWIVKNGLLDKWMYWTIERPLQIRNSSVFILIDGIKSFERIMIVTIIVLIIFRVISKKSHGDYNYISVVLLIPGIFLIFQIFFHSSTFILSKVSLVGTIYYPMMISIILIYLVFIAFSSLKLNFRKILILSILAVCIPTMLPQGFYGSSQSIWPLLILALILALSDPLVSMNRVVHKSVSLILSVIFFTASTMSLYLVRYDWLPLKGDISVGSANFGLLKTYGNYLPESEIMAKLFVKYKQIGKTAIFPGEEPIAFLTGQVPDTNVSASDPTTNPWYSDVKGWLESHSIEYLIFREIGQNVSTSSVNFGIISSLQKQFEIIERDSEYSVYKKID